MNDEIKNELVVPFTMIPNDILHDANLSLKQKGLLCYLISLPKGWIVYKTELENHFTDGRDSISNALEDLVKMEFVSKIENPKQKGKFSGFTYTVLPLRVNRNGLSATVNPSLINTNSNNTNRVNLNINPESLKKASGSGKKSSNTVKEKKEIKIKKEPGSYQHIIEFWLKEFHTDFTFNAMTGSKVKSIIKKITHVLTFYKKDITDESITDFFKKMCLSLPEYYKNKDLAVIDSKFNEIFTEIKNSAHGQQRTSPGQQSIFRTA